MSSIDPCFLAYDPFCLLVSISIFTTELTTRKILHLNEFYILVLVIMIGFRDDSAVKDWIQTSTPKFF